MGWDKAHPIFVHAAVSFTCWGECTSADMSSWPQRSMKLPPWCPSLPEPGASAAAGAADGCGSSGGGAAAPPKRGTGSSVPKPPSPARRVPKRAPPVPLPAGVADGAAVPGDAATLLGAAEFAAALEPGEKGSFRLTSRVSSGRCPCAEKQQ